MSSVLSSQSLVIAAAAMVLSSTALFLAFSWQKQESQSLPPEPKLRSCLYSGTWVSLIFRCHLWFSWELWSRILLLCLGDKKRDERKKKKVKFDANVKEPSGNGENFRRQIEKPQTKVENSCGNEIPGIQGIPLNRIALYNGILKNRGQRLGYSYW